MKNKILRSILPIMICAAMLTACGATGNTTQNTGNSGNSQNETVDSSTSKTDAASGSEASELAERAEQSFTLNLEFSDEAVLPTPENVQLFGNSFTIPVSFDDLLDLKVESHDDPPKAISLADYIQTYNEYEASGYPLVGHLHSEDTSTIDREAYYATAYLTLGEFTSGSVDRQKYPTLQSFVDTNNWYLMERPEAEMFGLTNEELANEADEYEKNDGKDVSISNSQFLLYKLVEKLGNPNYIYIFGNDGVDFLRRHFLQPEDNGEYRVGANLCTVGWIYSDFSIIVKYTEITKTSSDGKFTNSINFDTDTKVYYFPYQYDASSDSNQLSDFLSDRAELLKE